MCRGQCGIEDHIRRTARNGRWLAAHGAGVSTTEFFHDGESRRMVAALKEDVNRVWPRP
jgi:hypothetical protein